MGREAICTAHFDGHASQGRLLLETAELLFRGQPRLRIPLSAIVSVAADDGVLTVTHSNGTAKFDLGRPAAAWAGAIIDPPTLLSKLGVTDGTSCLIAGAVPSDVGERLPPPYGGRGPVDMVFLGANAAADLAAVAGLLPRLGERAALWIIYPKGQSAIRESDVLEAGRAAGLTDTKVAAVSPTHTGLRFTRRRVPKPLASAGPRQ
jgi:hypothetical protein